MSFIRKRNENNFVVIGLKKLDILKQENTVLPLLKRDLTEVKKVLITSSTLYKHADETDYSFIKDLLPWSETIPSKSKKTIQ